MEHTRANGIKVEKTNLDACLQNLEFVDCTLRAFFLRSFFRVGCCSVRGQICPSEG